MRRSIQRAYNLKERRHAHEIGTASASTLAVLTRNAQGDYSLNRTAGAAETHYYVANVAPRNVDVDNHGWKISTITWFYELGVADATSVDVLNDQTTLAQAANPVVASYGTAVADAHYDTAHDTAAERADKDTTGGEHALTVTVASPTWIDDPNTQVISELAVVLANTGTVKVRGCEIDYDIRGL